MLITRLNGALAVVLLVALLAAGAAPLPPGDPTDLPLRTADPELLANKSVREELRLSRDQVVEVEKAVTAALAKHKGEDLTQKAGRDKVASELAAALPKILDAGQVRRFRQIQLQQRGWGAFTDSDVTKALKLKDEQQKAIKETIESARMFPAAFDREREQDEKGKNLTRGAWLEKRLLDELDKSQQKTWEGLVGKPFELKPETP